MGNQVKIGIVGLGRAGYGMQCQELKGKEGMFKIVATCDIIKERTEQANKEFGSVEYSTIEDLLKDPNVDLVSIATRSCDHFSHAMMALEAGKDVLIEKPMCTTYAQALTLKEMGTKENGPRVYVRHNRRFEDNFLKLKSIIASGVLGDVFEINIKKNSYSRRDDWQTIKEFGGGQLLNWGPHIIDHSLRLLDSPIKTMHSDLKQTVAGGDCEDHLSITFVGENDRIVTMQISGGVCVDCPEYQVYGTKGAVSITKNEMHIKYIDPTQKVKKPVSDPSTPGQFFGKSGTFAGTEEIRWIEERNEVIHADLTVIWDYMYNAIKNNEEYPISLDEAISVIEVIDKVRKNTKFE